MSRLYYLAAFSWAVVVGAAALVAFAVLVVVDVCG